jgi:YhcN/YlaJ family sporulation lipoprotein
LVLVYDTKKNIDELICCNLLKTICMIKHSERKNKVKRTGRKVTRMKKMFTAVLIVTVLSTGCQLGKQNQGGSTGGKGTSVQETQRVPQTAQEKTYNQSPTATAQRLVELANRVPDVNRATAIVLGKTAIVGIDVDAKLDRPRVGTIKYTVAEALKKDPQGASAIVTADPDVVQRIREMNEDVRKGRPIAGFAEELADIAGRLVPQLPRSVGEKNQNPADRIQLKNDQQKK